MKANELRLGNWFMAFEIDKDHGEEYFKIESFSQNKEKTLGVEFRNGSCWSIIDLIDPIPLTEEWLIKLNYSDAIFENGYSEYELLSNGKMTIYLGEEDGRFSGGQYWVELNYVHELQNFVFATTKKELTITE